MSYRVTVKVERCQTQAWVWRYWQPRAVRYTNRAVSPILHHHSSVLVAMSKSLSHLTNQKP
jgi:hypothetical protein